MTGAYVYKGKVNVSVAVQKLDPSDVRVLPTGEAIRIGLKCRGPHGLTLVSENGLYRLVLRSDKEQARTFQDFVTGTVLPTIRKTGGYIQGEEKLDTAHHHRNVLDNGR